MRNNTAMERHILKITTMIHLANKFIYNHIKLSKKIIARNSISNFTYCPNK